MKLKRGRAAGAKRSFGRGEASSSRRFFAGGKYRVIGLLALCFLLGACSDAVTPPPVTDPNTGSLQVTIQGLPPEAEADVTVAGPGDYQEEVERSRTLTSLATGRYTVTVGSVVYEGETYPGALPGSRSQTELDVTRQAVSEVLVSYSSVGVVGAGEIAPGVTRSGMLSPGGVADYSFSGVEGVPLAFDFAGTREESKATYEVSIFRADDLDTPLYSERYGTSNSYAYESGNPVVGFAPPGSGDYVLRIGTQQSELSYTVTASYLSGTPEERRGVTRLEEGETVLGAVTAGSADRYLFSATADDPVTFVIDYEEGAAIYLVEVFSEGNAEPLYSQRVGTSNAMRELEFVPPAAGEYELRVSGQDSVLRYSLALAE